MITVIGILAVLFLAFIAAMVEVFRKDRIVMDFLARFFSHWAYRIHIRAMRAGLGTRKSSRLMGRYETIQEIAYKFAYSGQ